MPRFYYEYLELCVEPACGEDCFVAREFSYVLYDVTHGDQELARCDRHDDAQKIVDALNGYKPPAVGVFG